MKTLNHYKQLRESYACIIPKTAPAWELIEALDVLIATLQPDETQPHFLSVSVNLPKGWVISINHDNNTITLSDHSGVRRAYAYMNITGGYSMYWDGKYETTLENQTYAIKWLNGKANDL